MPYFVKVPLEVFVILLGGLFVSRYLQGRGVAGWLESRFSPVFVRFGIPREFVLIFFTSLVAGFAGEALLALVLNEGRIDERELIPGLMFINFPVFFSFAPLVIAITVPLVGWVGLAYLCVQLFISLVVSLTGMLVFYRMRRAGSGRPVKSDLAEVAPEPKSAMEAFKESLRMSLRVSAVVMASLFVIHFLFKFGVMDVVKGFFSRIPLRCLSADVMSISLAHALHLAAGAVVAGRLMDLGLPPGKVLLGMVWGYVFGVPIRGLINILPRYTAMYGVKRGARAWMFVQLFRGMVGVVVGLILCGVV